MARKCSKIVPFLQVIIRSILIIAFQSGQENYFELHLFLLQLLPCPVRAPVFGAHQFFGTSEHYGKAHGSLLSGWMNYNYTACCWFPTSGNSLILPPQFWQIRFESYWLRCSKCRILVLLRSFLLHNGFSLFLKWQNQYWSMLLSWVERSSDYDCALPSSNHCRVYACFVFESWKYFIQNCTWMKLKIQQNVWFFSLVFYVSSHNNNTMDNVNEAPCIPYSL